MLELKHLPVSSFNENIAYIHRDCPVYKIDNIKTMTQRYNNGERSDEFIEEYIDVLAEANDKEMLTKLVPQYLDNKYEKMLTDRKLFNFFMSYIESPYSKPYVFFLENKDKFTEQYGEGLSDRMVRMCHATCRSALGKAVQDGLIRVNPAIGCKLPPKKAREMQVLTREELQRFLIQAKFEGYYEVFLLDLATGLRRGELMALQWDDLNFKTGVLNVNKQVYDVRGQLQISTPKTKNSVRKIVLPPAVVAVLREYKKTVDSRWMFPSPVKEDCPITPGVVRRRLQFILEHAGCKHIRFHDLRHTFATLALENGMDVKTLSAILGHVSAATTLDIYTHITDDMQRAAAANIDRGIGKAAPQEDASELGRETVPVTAEKPRMTDFKPYVGRKRRPGTGCVSEINDHLFEGRYSPKWPDGKKHARNVYAHTREECEEKLKTLIVEMKAEIAEAKRLMELGEGDGRPPERKVAEGR